MWVLKSEDCFSNGTISMSSAMTKVDVTLFLKTTIFQRQCHHFNPASSSVGQSVMPPSYHPPCPSTPPFYSGISMCKYLLIPPPSLLLSLPVSLSRVSFLINGPHSLPPTLCMPVHPPTSISAHRPPLAPSLYSFL